MAKLSRRQSDRGFYIRTGRGYYGTKQVHPDAVRYLNRRDVYVGDEIPSHLMSKLSSKPGWLYTKEEQPHVTFFEFNDPSFGQRSAPRSAVQGTTRTVSVGVSSGKRKSRAASSRAVTPATVQSSKKSNKKRRPKRGKPNPGSWSDPLPEYAFGPEPMRRTLVFQEEQQKPEIELERAKTGKARLGREVAAVKENRANMSDQSATVHAFTADRTTDSSPTLVTMMLNVRTKYSSDAVMEAIGRGLGRVYREALSSERSWIILIVILFIVGASLLGWLRG